MNAHTLLGNLESNLGVLRPYIAMPEDEFMSDCQKYFAAKRALQNAIGYVIDITSYLLKQAGVGVAHHSGDRVLDLAGLGVIPGQLSDELVRAVALRNKMEHRRWEIDERRIHRILRERKLEDFDEFVRHITEYLEKEGIA